MNERTGRETRFWALHCSVTGELVAPVGRFTLDFHQNGAFVLLQTEELCESVLYWSAKASVWQHTVCVRVYVRVRVCVFVRFVGNTLNLNDI